MLLTTVCLEDGANGLLVLPQEKKKPDHQSILCVFTWKCPEVGGAGRDRLEARFRYYDLRVKTRSPSPFAWRPDFLAAPREAH